MSVSIDATSSSNSGSGVASSLTVSHTCAINANYLLVGVVNYEGDNSPNTISTVTYNAVGMTKVEDQLGTESNEKAVRATLWKLANPASGADDIVITPSADSRMVGGGVSFIGVSGTTPLGTAVKAASGTTSVSVNVTDANASGIVVNIAGKHNSGETLDVGAGQAEQWEDVTTNATAGSNCVGAMSTEIGSGTVAMSYSSSASRSMATVAVCVMAAPSGNQVIMIC